MTWPDALDPLTALPAWVKGEKRGLSSMLPLRQPCHRPDDPDGAATS